MLKLSYCADTPAVDAGGQVEVVSCILWVHDKAIEFRMKFCDRIFVFFARAHRGVPVFDIELANMCKVVECIGGCVRAECVPGHGAVSYLGISK